ncbi:MAG: type II secretion system protein [Pseudomonadota bacterium]
MKKGFTLLELSIVLLIISVLIGGVLLGKSLIVASELQTVMTDLDNYTSAAVNFKQAYQALPGDFSDATTNWGTDNNGCPAGGGSSGTCNGDSNGQISNSNGASKVGETFLFWQHLNKAGMFSKSLSNKAGSGGGYDSTISVNVPEGSILGSGFSVKWLGTLSGDSHLFDGFYGNVFQFGGKYSGDMTINPILTPENAAAIDTKIDDGSPATGKVMAYKSTSTINPNCTTTAVSATAAYNLTNNAPLCSLVFITGF